MIKFLDFDWLIERPPRRLHEYIIILFSLQHEIDNNNIKAYDTKSPYLRKIIYFCTIVSLGLVLPLLY